MSKEGEILSKALSRIASIAAELDEHGLLVEHYIVSGKEIEVRIVIKFSKREENP